MSYKVSKDYPRLKQLLDEGHKIVCWVTSRMDKMDKDLYEEIRQCVKDYIDTVSQWESDTFIGVMNKLIEHKCF